MNNLDIRERQIVFAGPGKVWETIINNFSRDFSNILVWNRAGDYENFPSYPIGELSHNHVSEDAIGIITAFWDWANKALDDFAKHKIPTALLATAYDQGLVDKYATEIPLLKAPNTVLPIVELMAIFQDFPDFKGIHMEIHESHQPGKKDASGTARKMIDIMKKKDWDFDFQWCNLYHPDEWISNFGDLISYRWEASKKLWVPDEHIRGWHGYHTYDRIYWDWENYQEFKRQIQAWYSKYKDSNLTWFKALFREKTNSFRFSHNIDGRDIYADGLRQMLPWFLEQEVWVHEVTDYLDR